MTSLTPAGTDRQSYLNESVLINIMRAQTWFYFTFSLAILVSLNGIYAGPLNGAGLDSAQAIVTNDYEDVSLYPEEAVETTLRQMQTALNQMREKLESVEERLNALEKPANFTRTPESTCKFDFEDGIDGWEKTGTAFNNQPTYGDNPTARNRGQPANQQGDWWIGGAEDRPSKTAPAGRVQLDPPQGTLTSPFFTITGRYISFLIGGGCDIKTVRAELIIADRVVKTATGSCLETMAPNIWYVAAFTGFSARVRLVDFSSGPWGHINFDDLRGDISCGRN